MGDQFIIRRRLTIVDKLFNIYLVLLPILQYYKSPVPSLNMATFLAVVFIPVLLLDTKGKVNFYSRLIPIVIYVIFITFNIILTSSLYQYNIVSNNLMDYLRLLLLVVSILFIGAGHFDCDYALSVMEKVLIASACYMVIQLFFYFALKHPITGNIPALVTSEEYKTLKDRVTGFYMEPAAYAQSAILYVVFMVFRKTELTKNEIIKIAVVIGGILISGSGQGYAFLVVVAIMWVIRYFFFNGMSANKTIKGVLIILLILLAGFILMRTSYGQNAVSRITSENSDDIFSSLGGKAMAGRTYTNKMFFALSPEEQLWGVGFGNGTQIYEHYYVNSLYYYLIEGGYVAIGVLIAMMVITIIRGDLRIRLFSALYIIMFFFTGCARPMMICFFFMFMLMGREDRFITIGDEDDDEDEEIYEEAEECGVSG